MLKLFLKSQESTNNVNLLALNELLAANQGDAAPSLGQHDVMTLRPHAPLCTKTDKKKMCQSVQFISNWVYWFQTAGFVVKQKQIVSEINCNAANM